MGCICAKKDPGAPAEAGLSSAYGSNPRSDGAAAGQSQYPAGYNPPLPPKIVGTFSNHGIEHDYEWNAVVKINQDRGSVDYPFVGGDKSALFCVMDGHGKHGDKVSDYCILSLHDYIYQHESEFMADPAETLIRAYVQVDKSLEQQRRIDSTHSGTSAVTVYLNDGKLVIANAGDSRAVLATSSGTIDLSIDQNPDTPGEQERLTAMGGVVCPPEEEGLSARVWAQDLSIGLSMARSLGDHKLAKHGVISTPVITTHDITSDDSFIILASDGIWEFIDSDEAANIIRQSPDDATEACRNLILIATRKWREEEGPYRDDITAIVVYLKPLFAYFKTQAGVKETRSSSRRNSTAAESEDSLTHALPVVNQQAAAMPNAVPSKRGETFRRRRLSTMGDDKTQKAAQQASASVSAASSPDADGKPNVRSKRRPSISPDMDPTGKNIEPS